MYHVGNISKVYYLLIMFPFDSYKQYLSVPGIHYCVHKSQPPKLSRTCWVHSTSWKTHLLSSVSLLTYHLRVWIQIFFDQNLECIVFYVRAVRTPVFYVFSYSSRLDLVKIMLTNGEVHRIILSVPIYFLSLRINETPEQFVHKLHQSMFSPSFDRTLCRLVGRFVDTWEEERVRGATEHTTSPFSL